MTKKVLFNYSLEDMLLELEEFGAKEEDEEDNEWEKDDGDDDLEEEGLFNINGDGVSPIELPFFVFVYCLSDELFILLFRFNWFGRWLAVSKFRLFLKSTVKKNKLFNKTKHYQS